MPSQPIQLSSQRGAAGDPETGATGITPEIGELYPLPPGSGDGILIDIDVVDSAGRVFPAPPVHMRDIVEMRGAGLALQLTTASAWAARPAEGGEGWGTQEDAAMTRVEISLVLRSHEVGSKRRLARCSTGDPKAHAVGAACPSRLRRTRQ